MHPESVRRRSELALFLKFLRRRIDPNVRVVVANPAFGSLDPWMTAKIGKSHEGSRRSRAPRCSDNGIN
jgi:hypothetical protein